MNKELVDLPDYRSMYLKVRDELAESQQLYEESRTVMQQALEVIELHPYPGWDHVWETKQALKRVLNLEE